MILVVGTSLSITVGCQKEKAANEDKASSTKADNPDARNGQKQPGAKNINGKPNPALKHTPPVDIPAPSDVAAIPADAKKTDSGLAYKVIKTADEAGDKPALNDEVQIKFTGWTTDGKMVDTSTRRRSPTKLLVNKGIPGWIEGLQLMRQGETFRFWIPEELGYKSHRGGPKGMLVYDIELQAIKKAPAVPSNVAAPPKGTKKTPKGVHYKVLTQGKGKKDHPRKWDKVSVHYSGWTTDGKMFDSSIMRGKPSSFGVSGVIPGWTDALLMMNTGDKWLVWIPEELAYKGRPGRPQGMLVFEMELLSIEKLPEPPPPPAVPKDVKAPPKNAKKTDSGVFYKTLKPGKGESPTASSKVKVHYTGWTTDGKMFDSSVTRGKPISFGLGQVIPGWRDGLQTMKVGEKARLWIPEELAYKGKPGAPQGMLVFDVELLAIESK